MLTLQAGMTKLGELDFYASMAKTLAPELPVLAPYQSISRFGTSWGFIVASRGEDPRRLALAEIDRRVKERVRGSLRFYDGEAHQHLFSLPKFLRAALASQGRVITDAEPLIVE